MTMGSSQKIPYIVRLWAQQGEHILNALTFSMLEIADQRFSGQFLEPLSREIVVFFLDF
jgi:hypothetical protein